MNLFSIKTILILLLMALLAFLSCEKELNDNSPSNSGEVKFTLGTPSGQGTRSKSLAKSLTPSNTKAILVTIKNSTGQVIYDKKKITLYYMVDGYVSSPLTLAVGQYSLEEFFVVDGDDKVVAVTPL